MWIDSSCFLFSAEQLSQTTSQYSSSGRIKLTYICSNDFLLTLNFSVRMRFNRAQAFDAISWIWLDHVHDFDKMRPRCLWLSVSGSIMLFMNNGGCCGGSSLRDSTIEKVFRSWKLTNQFAAQVLMVSRSVLIRFAAIWADSTIMYRLVSSANNRIEQPIFFTISFMYIKKSKGPRIDPWGTPASTGAQSDACPLSTTRCLRPKPFDHPIRASYTG